MTSTRQRSDWLSPLLAALGSRRELALLLWPPVVAAGILSGGATERFTAQALALATVVVAVLAGAGGVFAAWRSCGFLILVPAVVGLLQLVPLPRALLHGLSPMRAQLTPAGSDWSPLSLYPFATLDTAFLWIQYALSFALGALIVRSRVASGWAKLVLLVLVGLQSLYGLLAQGAARASSSGVEFTHATGSYLSRNQFACFLVTVAPLVLAGLLFRERGRRWSGSRRGPEQLSRQISQGLLLGAVVLATMFTFSRQGLGALGLGLGVVLLVALWRAESSARWSLAAGLFVIAGLGIAGSTQVLTQWFERLRPEVLRTDQRWIIWRDAWRLAADHPFTGVGLGAFPAAFPPYAQDSYEGLVLMDTHNELLQLGIEIGLPAASVLYAAMLAWAAYAAACVARQRSCLADSAALAGIAGGSLAFIAVSLVDFPFHAPGNAMLAFTLMGFGHAGAQEVHRRRQRWTRRRRRDRSSASDALENAA